MPDVLAVGTKFTATNKTGGAYRGLSKSTKKFAKTAKDGFGKASSAAGKFGSIVKGILVADVLRRGTMLLQRGIADVGDEFLQFDKNITAAAAKFPDKIARGTAAFIELENAARGVGAVTEFTAAQASLGLEEYAKAGIDATTAMGLLAGTAELATNAQVDFATAASISLDALDSFNLRSKDATVTAANLATVNDTLTTVVTSAKLNFEDFAETLKFAGPVAEATGAKLKDMAVLTGIVAKAGIRGSLAGTTLKNTYLRLAAPVGKGATALKRLGIKISDSSGNMRDALDVLIDFKEKVDEFGNVKRLKFVDAVFGKRAIAGVSKVLSLGVDDLKDYRKQIGKSENASIDMATAIRQSLINRLAVLKSSLIEIGFKIIKAFSGKGSNLLDRFIKRVQAFDPQPIIDGIVSVGKFIKNTISFIVKYKDVILGVIAAFVALKVGLAVASAIPAIAAAIAAMATPAGRIVLAIAALVAVIVIFRKELTPLGVMIKNTFIPSFEAFKKLIQSLQDVFGGAGDGASRFMSGLGGFLSMLMKFPLYRINLMLESTIDNIRLLVRVFHFFVRMMKFVGNSIYKFIKPALDWLGWAIGKLTDQFLKMNEPLISVISAIGDFFGGVGGGIGDIIDKSFREKDFKLKVETEVEAPDKSKLPKIDPIPNDGIQDFDFANLFDINKNVSFEGQKQPAEPGGKNLSKAPIEISKFIGEIVGQSVLPTKDIVASGELESPSNAGDLSNIIKMLQGKNISQIGGDTVFGGQQSTIDPTPIVNAIANQETTVKVNVDVNSPVPGTSATATANVVKAPSINTSQSGKAD